MSNLSRRKEFFPSSSTYNQTIHAIREVFDKAMHNISHLVDFRSSDRDKFEALILRPSVDIVEDKDSFKVELEMPGLSEEEIQVSVDEESRILTIRGEKESSQKDEGKDYCVREISYGSYERSIFLPAYVDMTQPKATFKKGMLWVSFPKKPGYEQPKNLIKIEKAED